MLEKHLKAAWEKLDAGDLEGARKHVEQAIAVDADAAETQVAVGAIAAQEGDLEASVAAFRRAMKADPEWFEPAFLHAELLAGAGELEDALKACEAALDRAEEEEEYLDALLLKSEIALGLDDQETASATLAELPPVDLPTADHHVRAGGCFLEIDDLENAAHHFDAAMKAEPNNAEAWHGRGMVCEAEGEHDEQVVHFRKVRELDLRQPAPEWHLTADRLDQCVEAALAELPEKARKLLVNVPIVVEDYPSDALVADGLDPRLLGLFTGPSLADETNLMPQSPVLQQIFLFQRNLERQAQSAEEVEEEIRITLLHETGHFFGMDEGDLADVGLD
jgi:predicted Zn-dependent protease with MMP-like domain/Flp pilus assembly protein TadD